ncbi:hypothetical protein LguiA_000141 [Lonicera macranthoides]
MDVRASMRIHLFKDRASCDGSKMRCSQDRSLSQLHHEGPNRTFMDLISPCKILGTVMVYNTLGRINLDRNKFEFKHGVAIHVNECKILKTIVEKKKKKKKKEEEEEEEEVED